MNIRLCCAALALLGLAALAVHQPLAAQDKKDDKKFEMEFPKPGPEHKILAKFVGTFDAKVKMWMPGSAEPNESKGTMKRSLIMDGRYVREDYTGAFAGSKFQGMGILGYDTNAKKFFAHWIDTLSTGVIVTHGTYHPDQKMFVFRGEEMMGGQKFKMRDVVKQVGEDEQIMEMYRAPVATPDKEFKVMEITLTRKMDKKKKDKK